MRAAIEIGPQLARAIEAQAARQGGAVTAEPMTASRWASITFSGARHRLRLRVPSSRWAEQWLEALPESEVGLSGHLVADLSVDIVRRDAGRIEAEIAVLTLEMEN